jgi:hypothetical protein
MMKLTTCTCCQANKAETRGRVTNFTVDGITHYLPEMWIIGRLRTNGNDRQGALLDWAYQCELEARRETRIEKAA